MGKFLNDHPIISLLMLSTVCSTIVRVIRPDAYKTTVTTVNNAVEVEDSEDDSNLLHFTGNAEID